MTQKRQRKATPPWWVRLPLYLATYPKPEFYDYRIQMQRDYLRVKRKGPEATQNWNRSQLKMWMVPTAMRLVWAGLGVFRFMTRLP